MYQTKILKMHSKALITLRFFLRKIAEIDQLNALIIKTRDFNSIISETTKITLKDDKN